MSATAPTTFVQALTEAEGTAFRHLCESLGSDPGRQAYLGDAPASVNAWSFRFLSPVASDASFWASHNFPAMAYGAEAACMYASRATAQEWVMGVVKALPLVDAANVVQFRISNVGPVVGEAVQLSNETKPWQVWRATVTFDAVFLTGGKLRQ